MTQSTTLSVDFTSAAFLASSTLRLERSNKKGDDTNVAFFRAHGIDGHTLTATAGQLSRQASKLRKFVSSFAYFSGTAESALDYPAAEEVQITSYGKFFTPDGTQITTPKVRMDASRNSLVMDEPAYGVVLVEYKAPYDLWRATFAGVCPSVETSDPPADASIGSADDDREYEGLDPMVVYGWKDGVLKASLALDPPPCEFEEGNSFQARYQMDAGSTRLTVREDPENRVRYAGSAAGIAAECSVLVYPASPGISVTANNGKLYSATEIEEVTIKEMVSFSGGSSARLRFPPKDVVSISAVAVGGSMIDSYGRTFTPGVYTWGDTIYSVQWLSKFAYQNKIGRTVDRDEIVITNAFRAVLPAYGSVEVTYSTQYQRHKYEFEYDEETERFLVASIVAKKDKDTGTLMLNGPQKQGYN